MESKKKTEEKKNEGKNFEEVLEELGGFGKFQFLSLFLILVLEIPAAFVSFLPIFTGAKPNDWTCNGIDIESDDLCSCNGTMKSKSGDSSIVAEWNLVCDSAWVSDFVTSVQMCGMIFGNIFAGRLSDQYGRKPLFLACILVMMLGNGVSSVAPNPYVYAFSRLLCGAGLAAFLSITSVYSMEFQTPRWRPLGGAVGPWGEGIMIMSLMAYYIRSWRTLTWATTLPFCLIVVIYPTLPESPRWLLRNQKLKEAKRAINMMAKINGKKGYTQEFVNKLGEQERGSKSQRFSYLDFFRFKELRRTTIFLMLLWGVWSITNFGIGFNIKNFPGNVYVNVVLLGLTDVIGYPASLLISNRLGRRYSLAFFMVFAASFFVALTIFEFAAGLSNYDVVLITLCLMGKLGISGARGCVRTVTGESYPTSIRTMGMCLCGIANSIAAIVAPQLAFLGTKWPSVPYFAFTVISLGGAILSFLLKETQGKALPTDFGGDSSEGSNATALSATDGESACNATPDNSPYRDVNSNEEKGSGSIMA